MVMFAFPEIVILITICIIVTASHRHLTAAVIPRRERRQVAARAKKTRAARPGRGETKAGWAAKRPTLETHIGRVTSHQTVYFVSVCLLV